MNTSGEKSESDRPAPKRPVFVPPRTHRDRSDSKLHPANRGANAGRQAYTVHVARHDRQHHKPGRA